GGGGAPDIVLTRALPGGEARGPVPPSPAPPRRIEDQAADGRLAVTADFAQAEAAVEVDRAGAFERQGVDPGERVERALIEHQALQIVIVCAEIDLRASQSGRARRHHRALSQDTRTAGEQRHRIVGDQLRTGADGDRSVDGKSGGVGGRRQNDFTTAYAAQTDNALAGRSAAATKAGQ